MCGAPALRVEQAPERYFGYDVTGLCRPDVNRLIIHITACVCVLASLPSSSSSSFLLLLLLLALLLLLLCGN
jgi:hypothetical protein